ncbi:MAG: DUF2147 domain-containing protein [Novosphingobium sp.]
MEGYLAYDCILYPIAKACSAMKPLFLIAAIMSVATTSSAGVPTDLSLGTWRNPKVSVHIRAEHCGDRMCGTVVWANEKAKADARKGSAHPLIGVQLFQNFVEEKPGAWRGKIFVSDIGKTFTGSVSVIDKNRIEAIGCLLGHLGCKTHKYGRE